MSASESIVSEHTENGKRSRSETDPQGDLPSKLLKKEEASEGINNGNVASHIEEESGNASTLMPPTLERNVGEPLANKSSDDVKTTDEASKLPAESVFPETVAPVNTVETVSVAMKPLANDPRKLISVTSGTAPAVVQVVAAPASIVVSTTPQVVTAPAPVAVATSTPQVFSGGASFSAESHVGPTQNSHVFAANSLAGATNPSLLIEEKGEVSPLYVGRVIGKGGEMIRDLQARSGARIDVDQNVPPGHPRVITYKGTRQTVEFAKQLVAILSREGASENDLPLGHASLEHVVIPSRSVGKVIGRNGEMIRELQSRSQAKIQIDHTGRSGHPPDQKLVTITGTKESVAKGAEMVRFLVANPLMDAQQSLNMLLEEKVRSGLPWGSGPPYPNLPSQGMNMNPQTSQTSFGAGVGYQPLGSGLVPQSVTYGGTLVGSHHHSFPTTSQDIRYGGSSGGREVEMIHVSKQYMGRIIGGKGVTINDLQRRSGCEIQINQDVPVGKDCEITLKGTRPAIETAKLMINTIIETGPQHPYAGGADTYGGGVKNHQQQPNTFSHSVGYQQPSYDQNFSQPVYGQPTSYMQQSFAQPTVTSSYGVYAAPQPAYGAFNQQSMNSLPLPPPQPKAPPPPMMLSPWKTATAPDGQIYYYNDRTGETTWEKPAGMP